MKGNQAVLCNAGSGSAGLVVCETGDIDEAEWDDFVRNHEEPHHEQMTIWPRVKAHSGWAFSRLALKRQGKMAACAQVLEIRIKRVLLVGYLCRGPLVADKGLNERMVRELREFSKRRGYAYLAISLPYYSSSIVGEFEKAGFLPRPIELPPEVWVRANLLIDLKKPVETLLMDLRCSTRREVRKGMKFGVTVREGGNADFPMFCDLVLKLCERRGVSSNMPSEEAVREMWDAFAPRSQMKLFVAEVQGRPVCALSVLFFGKWARAWRIGWNGEFKEAYPTKVLYWNVFQICKDAGYEFFDWIGVDERDAREMLEGRQQDGQFHCPITAFKTGFGGELMMLPGEWCYFPNQILRNLFASVGPRVLGWKWVRKLARRTHSSAVANRF